MLKSLESYDAIYVACGATDLRKNLQCGLAKGRFSRNGVTDELNLSELGLHNFPLQEIRWQF